MASARDLTGQRFGKLVALRPTEERKSGRVMWECQCDCGNIAFVRSINLVNGSTQSCGCLKTKKKDLTGQRFGKLVALRPTDERKDRKVVWECQCDCGNIAFVRSVNLTSGHTQSCGCLYKEELTGQRFGKLVALQPTEERKGGFVMWECQCDCGNIVFVRSVNLISGHTQSCGCLYKEELTGQRFGKLVALRPTDERKDGSIVWECQCDCGNIAFVSRKNLVQGRTKSCGCLRKATLRSQYKDLTGQRFGKLIALRPTEVRKNGRVVWECQCDCGNIAFVRRANLVNGRTKSCGCLQKGAAGRKYKDLTGQRFGKLIALRPTEERKNNRVVWECQCDCGNIAFVRVDCLLNGKTKSCGCLSRIKGISQYKELIGQRFGKLIALRATQERKEGGIVWECQCDCGNIAFVSRKNLVQGRTKSCGCLRGKKDKSQYKDLTGQRFGKLIALRPIERQKNGNVIWECRCDCGNVTSVPSLSLTSGYKRSCGCWKR